MCLSSIHFASSCDLLIGFWSCSNSIVFLLHFKINVCVIIFVLSIIESKTGTTHVLIEVVGTFREYRRGNQNGQSREIIFFV